MTRKAATMLVLAGLALWAHPAFAQSTGTAGSGSTVTNNASGTNGGNIRVLISKVYGDDSFDSTRQKKLGLAQCTDGKMTVSLSGLPNSPQYPYLEVWWATGTSNCEMGNRGSRTPSTDQCTKLKHNREETRFTNLTTAAVEVDFGPVCQLNSEKTGGSDGTKTLYFVLLGSKGSSENATFYGTLTFELDLSAPRAPTITTAGRGETDIVLQWDQAEAESGYSYWVAADWSNGALVRDGGAASSDGDGGTSNSECPSGYLIPGKGLDPEARPSGLYMKSTTKTEWHFTADDFHGAKVVPAAVLAQDLAGNVSVVSEVACLKVVPTDGFWDLYKGDGGPDRGAAEPGCACTTPGARSGRMPALAIAPFAILLASAFARRRIRRRAR